ncbi:peptidase [Priestia aryabhattai]|uniref:C40 family peptidase n=1 Tax=Bacillaceae TaxID=186817 RepID=UPI000BA04DE1|nr:C40 family peptidase [Bacillus sp. CBEL-1]OZT14081.1 peptidase [Priestia aryabhattai]TDB55110.1 NlpC/P60 family protein [Bacillus sp. CBEL-1]USY56507.1 C40 family peptidase [Bacillus sp. 1780r2a1]
MNAKRYVVTVSVATVWTSAESPRSLDQVALESPVDIKEWLRRLTYENRLALCNENLVQTQLLFGEEVEMIKQEGNWCYVLIPSQPSKKNNVGYPGWVPASQLKAVELQKQDASAQVIARKTLLVIDNQTELMLSYRTTLPVVQYLNEHVEVETPLGRGLMLAKDVNVVQSDAELHPKTGAHLVSEGKRFLDLPYLWGGMSSYGFDCSGFTYSLHKANGYTIPRDASDQATSGKVVSYEEMEPGDLLFFAYEQGKGFVHHVAMYYGNGQIIHSPKTGKAVEVIPIKGMEYEDEICAIRRYWT